MVDRLLPRPGECGDDGGDGDVDGGGDDDDGNGGDDGGSRVVQAQALPGDQLVD